MARGVQIDLDCRHPEQLVGLGAAHVRTDTDEDDYYAVLRDPEGNELCIC